MHRYIEIHTNTHAKVMIHKTNERPEYALYSVQCTLMLLNFTHTPY